jgi:transglutaminase-like putative cysteine protease
MQDSRFHFFTACVLSFGLALTLSPSIAAQISGRAFTIAPAPTWIRNESLATTTAEQRAEGRDGVVYLLSDQQVRVTNTTTASGTERYHHHIHEVIAQPGVEHVSQLELEFDPSYQRLVIHRIQIRRGKQTINALRPQEIRLLQKEDEMEQQLFNGTLAALVILNDVRVGDVVEYEYSVNGANPILAGRFADVNYLVEGEPIARLRYRLLWPAGRPLQHQMRNLELKPQEQRLGETIEYVWERTNLPAPDDDAETTLAADEYPTLYLTEFKSWQEVAAWAAALYRLPGPLSAAVRQQIEKWRQVSPRPEEQMLAALRFIQDEIRYLGIELGPHSHQPHQPAQVLARRYGDCKDKALLFATALRELGIEAYPALVSTDLHGRVQELLPSPFAFDHVIAQVKFNGQTYWFDPTVSLQRGGLAQHYNPEYGRGLAVHAGGAVLEEIPLPAPARPLKTIKEIYTVNPDNQAARLEIVYTYRGINADTMRAYLAKNTLKDLVKDRMTLLYARDRSFTAEGKPEVKDDAANNTIVISERYQCARFWREGARVFSADRLTAELPALFAEAKEPVRLTYPFDAEQQIEIRTPLPLNVAAVEGSVSNEAVQFDYQRAREGRTIKLNYRLRTLRGYVSANDTARLATDIERIEALANFRLSSQALALGALASPVGLGGLIFLGALLLSLPLVAFVAYKIWQARRTSRAPREVETRVNIPLPGSTPAHPLRVPDEMTLTGRLTASRCECGGGYQQPLANTAREAVIYDGKRLLVVQMNCVACGTGRDVYFELAAGATPNYTAQVTEAPEQLG